MPAADGDPLASRAFSVAAGLLAGVLADFAIADPGRGHPVAGYGTLASTLERGAYAPTRGRGVGFTAIAVGVPVLLASAVDRRAARSRFAVVAVSTWAVVGARSLRTEAGAVERLLRSGDLPGARIRVTHLVGRDTSALDANEVARAAVESVAENTCDAVVAPLFWGALAGLPGLVGYRAINTLDAMVGHRSARYERFGWASARLDDLANFVPARACAALTALAAPAVGGSPTAAVRVTRRDGRRHPSPNSGMAEAAFAGALHVRLGGRNVYGDRVEDRPVLGDGPAVTVADLLRVRRLSAAVTVLSAALAAGIAARSPLLGDRRRICA